MLRFVFYSLLLHVSIGAVLYFGIPSWQRDVNREYAIVMDVVTVSELTNIKAQKAEQKKQETQEASAPEDKPVAVQPNPPQPKSEEKPAEEKVEPLPDKKKEPEAKAKPQSDPKKMDKKEEKKPAKDQKVVKEKDIFSKSFLKNMEAQAAKKDKKKEASEISKSLQAQTNKSYNDTMPMSISEIDAIRSQVQKAWNTAAFSGANNMGMQTTLYIKLDMEGNVLEVRPDKGKAASPYHQAFIDSAVRAVKISSPLKSLPKDKYNSWKEIEFVFDSSGMIY